MTWARLYRDAMFENNRLWATLAASGVVAVKWGFLAKALIVQYEDDSLLCILPDSEQVKSGFRFTIAVADDCDRIYEAAEEYELHDLTDKFPTLKEFVDTIHDVLEEATSDADNQEVHNGDSAQASQL